MAYLFICSGETQHKSHSAAREPRGKTCPECHAPTVLVEDEGVNTQTSVFFPGIYSGREGVFAKTVGEIPDEDVITLVRYRINEDGEWDIEQGHVGPNNESEPKMRKMMEWASDPTNIAQALEHIYKEENAHIRTVDYLCRDMANASKWIAGGNASD